MAINGHRSRFMPFQFRHRQRIRLEHQSSPIQLWILSVHFNPLQWSIPCTSMQLAFNTWSALVDESVIFRTLDHSLTHCCSRWPLFCGVYSCDTDTQWHGDRKSTGLKLFHSPFLCCVFRTVNSGWSVNGIAFRNTNRSPGLSQLQWYKLLNASQWLQLPLSVGCHVVYSKSTHHLLWTFYWHESTASSCCCCRM